MAAQSIVDIGRDFTQSATIQGLAYIFSQNISALGRLYWIFSVSAMILLGLYWTSNMYIGWQDAQVKLKIFWG